LIDDCADQIGFLKLDNGPGMGENPRVEYHRGRMSGWRRDRFPEQHQHKNWEAATQELREDPHEQMMEYGIVD
jgi:hypothetical protein